MSWWWVGALLYGGYQAVSTWYQVRMVKYLWAGLVGLIGLWRFSRDSKANLFDFFHNN